jgi:hypothetical protein
MVSGLRRRPLRSRFIASTLVACVLGVASPLAAQDALPAEALVAIVGAETPQAGTDLVLMSDVDLRARLDLGPSGLTVEPTRALYAATLDEILGEILIAREADRLRTSEPTESEVRAQRDRLVATLGGEPMLTRLLARLGADPAEIDVIARRRATVEAFLRANLEGTTTVSDARVEEVFASNDHPFAGMTLEEAREPLRAWLAMRSLSADVARWVAVLRTRTPPRVLIVLDPEGLAEREAATPSEKGSARLRRALAPSEKGSARLRRALAPVEGTDVRAE